MADHEIHLAPTHATLPQQRQDVIVLGAGPAGLTAAGILAASGRRVLVLDAARHIGGTHRSHEIGPYTFDVGSIFYEDQARLFDQFPGTRALCPPAARVQRRIAPDGQVLHYPVEPRDILAWPPVRLWGAIADMVWSRLTTRTDGTVDTACRARLGRRIYEGSGLRSYITRFHHTPPETLDEEFFYRRMGFIEKKTRTAEMAKMLWRALRRKPVRRGPPAALRVRPPSGFTTLFTEIRTQLEAQGVTFQLGQTVSAVTKEGEGFRVATAGQSWQAGAVVSAMPLHLMHRAVFGTDAGLQSLDLLTLFVSATGVAKPLGNVLFNFHGEGRWKRATLYSRIYPGLMQDRDFMSVEVTLAAGSPPDPDAAFADFCSHVRGLGLITGDIALEGHDVVTDAYPLYLKGRADAAAPILAQLTAFGIVSVGRQGRFEYLPTASGVIRRVAQELQAASVAAG
ncbi:MAG: NAD(P)-binding protein [Pseudomonadota bacterium]